MSRSRKLLSSFLIVAVAAGVATYGTFSAFSASTQNDNNQIATGTVVLGDNDVDTALYSDSNLKPDTDVSHCITVSYTGSLDADVRLYVPAQPATADLAPFTNLKIESSATAADWNCSGFNAETTLYDGTLSNFLATRTDWASGLVDYPGTAATKWTNAAGSVSYKVTVRVPTNAAAAGKQVTAHTLKWEARNQ